MAIESDSIQPVPRLRQELFTMMTVAADELQRLGASVDVVDLGSQEVLHSIPTSVPLTSCHFQALRAPPSLVVARWGCALIFSENAPHDLYPQ